MPLTPENISIDVVNTFIYIIALWRIAQAFYYNHLTTRQRIILGGFSILGVIFIYQTCTTLITGTIANVFMWDIYNFIHIMIALSIVTLLKDNKELS